MATRKKASATNEAMATGASPRKPRVSSPAEKLPVAGRVPAPASPVASGKRRVFVVDDHPILRQGLVQLLDKEPDLHVVGEGEDVYESLRAIRAAAPDLCLVDVSLKGGDGIELVKELKAGGGGAASSGGANEVAVLVLSMHDEQLYAERALRAGARGYVMKQEPPATLLAAVRQVLAGEIYVSPKMGATLLHRMVGSRTATSVSPMDRLTDRELEVFRMIAAGLRVREIAERLFLSAKTVEAHREHIKEKLGIRSSNELLRFAIRNSPEAN